MMQGKILVVDDSAYARKILSKTLLGAGLEVQEASSGLGAIEAYFLSRPDAVLLDLTMEDMSGLDVLKRLREIDPSARVIVISADVQSSTAGFVREAGAHRFIGKPAESAAIMEAVTSALAGEP
jgi:two-component system, chemotaxis family, chemotaxis protein CheY